MSEVMCPVALHAREAPQRLAVLAPHEALTYAELNAVINTAHANLLRTGLYDGNIVGIALPRSLPYIALLWAVLRAKMIAFPINPKYPVVYLSKTLGHVRCRTVIVPYGESDLISWRKVHALSPATLLQDNVTPVQGSAFNPDQPAVLVHTSGSTGSPKSALLSWGNLYENASYANHNLPLQPGDRWLLSLPLYHVSGLGIVFRCLTAGATIVIAGPTESYLEAIERYGITHISLVPTQLYRMLQDPHAVSVLRSLKGILLGGAAASESLIARVAEENLPVCTTYGLTETASQVTTTALSDPKDKLKTAGRPIIPNTVRINPQGIIEVCGPTLFLGYVHETRVLRPVNQEGWFLTHDIGHVDKDGYLHVLGRADNVFQCGGENVQPEEIERVLGRLPQVVQAVVVPVPDAEWGAVPVAFVAQRDETPLDQESLIKALREELPPFKIPRHFLPWKAALPGDEIKWNRRNLSERAQELIAAIRLS